MKPKHRHEDPPITVIADPKKLAWLKAEIEKGKARAAQRGRIEKKCRE